MIFKIADNPSEFNQIHKLNYATFVDEIPQHSVNSSRQLIDKFNEQNTYIVCLKGSELIGMIAVRDKRPFSLDLKLNDLDNYLPKSDSICEIRLLSIKKRYRSRKVIGGLFALLAEFCEKNRYDLALISATIHQLKLYKKLGFLEFGPLVGTEGAYFQPMYLTPNSYTEFKIRSKVLRLNDGDEIDKILLLPGPVKVKKEVEKSFKTEPVSHRSRQFLKDFNETKKILCEYTASKRAEIFSGSGTVANDIIAAQLSKLKGKGVVLVNGHFGERLIDHSKRFSLDFIDMDFGFGGSFDYKTVENLLRKTKPSWLWFVHCETSTGMLNDIHRIADICSKYKVKLCADCISSIGSFKFSLNQVYLASGVSGKSFAAYPGLSFVCYNHQSEVYDKIPRYLDLGFYNKTGGIPFTLSSNLLYAFKSALENLSVEEDNEFKERLNVKIRKRVEEIGLKPFIPFEESSNLIITIQLPFELNSLKIGDYLEARGIKISYRSNYLIEKNFIQISLMGEVTENGIELFLDILKDCIEKFRG